MAFSTKTLLIIGAGASAEIDFPIGGELKERIRRGTKISFDGFELSGDNEFCRILEDHARVHYGGQLQPILDACDQIHKNVLLSGSIDQFLSSHQNERAVVPCAKLAIAYQIAKAERGCHLNENTGNKDHCDFAHLRETWFPRLWSRLQNGQPIEQWTDFFANFRAISFNYDRCLEQFLSLALNGFCRIPMGEARAFVQTLDITHIYGTLGSIDSSSKTYCPFAPDRNAIHAAADRILTFSETVADNIKQEVSDHLLWADRVVVLGFSYANVNMELLPRLRDHAHWIIGTAMGISDHNRAQATQQLNWKLDKTLSRTTLSQVSCAKLFDDFELSLN